MLPPEAPRTGFNDTLWAIDPGLFSAPELPGAWDLDLSSLLTVRATGAAVSKRTRASEVIDPTTMVGSIAMIDVAGPLTTNPGLFRLMGCSTAATLPEIQGAVRRAADDEKCSSILLRVSSPGGTVFGTPEVADEVWRARGKKRVVAHVSKMCASAAMWIASQATEVVAGRVAHLGSIGVYGVVEDWSEAAKKEGVKIHAVRSTPMKGIGIAGTEITEEMLETLQAEIDATAEIFIQDIARGLGISASEARALHDGKVYIGQEAIKKGLASRIISLEETLGEMTADDGRLRALQLRHRAIV